MSHSMSQSRCTLALIFTLSLASVQSQVAVAAGDWVQVQTPNLHIYTDLDDARAHQLAQRLARFAQVVDTYLPDTDVPVQPLHILAYAKRRDFARLMNPRHFAAFTQPGLDRMLLVIAPALGTRDRFDSLLLNAQHEYVHYRLRSLPTALPPWLDEGMAGLLEQVKFEQSGSEWIWHIDHRAIHARYDEDQRVGNLNLADVIATRRYQHWSAERLRAFYGLAAQFVHFLKFVPPNAQPNFLQSVLLDPQTLMVDVYRAEQRDMAREFERYRRRQGWRGLEQPEVQPLLPIDQLITVSPYPEVELFHLQARAAESINPRRATKLYRQVLKIEPEHVEAWVDLARTLLRQRQLKASATALETANTLDAGNAAVLIQRAQYIMSTCREGYPACLSVWRDASSLLRQALELDENRLDGMYMLGVIELLRGRAGLARNYLQAALSYAPWSPRLNYHFGECLRILGDPRALIYLENALNWAQDENVQKLASLSLARVDGPMTVQESD